MEIKTSDIEYRYILNKTKEIEYFIGTIQYPDDMSITEIYHKTVKEHPEHQIFFQSFKFEGLRISDYTYIG